MCEWTRCTWRSSEAVVRRGGEWGSASCLSALWSKSRRGPSWDKNVDVVGVVVIVFVLVIVLPVSFLMAGAAIAAVLSMALKSNAEATHEGSELIDLNR